MILEDCGTVIDSHELRQSKQKRGSLRSRDAAFLFTLPKFWLLKMSLVNI